MKLSSFFFFLLTICVVSATKAQVSGEWYGVGKVKKAGDHNSYLAEMVLKQTGKKVTGEFSYFFRSATIKTKISGTFDPQYRVLELTARPLLNFLAKNENGADCPMEGSFTLKVTKTETTLTGQFNPTYDYRITCPAIDIKFVKSVPTKDTLIKPEPEDPEETEKPAVTTIPKPVLKTKSDTAKKSVVIVRPPIIHKSITEEQKTVLALKLRSFDKTPVIEVDADSLKVSLYDNGEVDNDTISVFYNRKLVKLKQMLSDKPYTFTVPVDTTINEISMFAENLGKIPPNTAIAIIYAGDQRFELGLTSTFIKNAALRFKRKIKHVDPKNIN